MAHRGRRGGTRTRALLLAAAIAFIVPTATPVPVEAAGPPCATPGRDGTATLSGVINTYYPGTATAAAGTSTITLGPATGAARSRCSWSSAKPRESESRSRWGGP